MILPRLILTNNSNPDPLFFNLSVLISVSLLLACFQLWIFVFERQPLVVFTEGIRS